MCHRTIGHDSQRGSRQSSDWPWAQLHSGQMEASDVLSGPGRAAGNVLSSRTYECQGLALVLKQR